MRVTILPMAIILTKAHRGVVSGRGGQGAYLGLTS